MVSEGKQKKKRKSKQPGDEAGSSAAGGSGNALAEHLETQRTRVICGPDINYHVRSGSLDWHGAFRCTLLVSSTGILAQTQFMCAPALCCHQREQARITQNLKQHGQDRLQHVQVNSVTSAMAYMSVGYDNSWDHEQWAHDFQIVITDQKRDMLEFELINVDPAIVNSLRRILISEVPTVAIEHVFVTDNDSEMAEEVLAHRLGLVPLTVDAEELEDKDGPATDKNTVIFKLHVRGSRVCTLPT